LAFSACGKEPEIQPETPASIDLVLLISIDTLRRDRLGLYGAEQMTSPILDAFAAAGTVFEDANAPASWTLPSHASMLTGLYPLRHRLLKDGAHLDDEIPTLAGLLAEGGWNTAAAVNSIWLKKRTYRVTRDFEEYLEVDEERERRSPNTWVTDQAMEWIDASRDRPFFLFAHYYDVHTDYISLPAFERLFVTPYDGPVDGTGWQLQVASLPEAYHELCNANTNPKKCVFGMKGENLQLNSSTPRPEFSPTDIRNVEQRYDAGIRQLDSELGRLFRFLEEGDRLASARVVIVSDHGEEFMDHGRFEHGYTTYQEVLGVPLIVRGVGIPAGLRLDTPVSLVDLMPTILAWAGLPAPAGIDGFDLTSLFHGEVPPRFNERFLFGEASAGLGWLDGPSRGMMPIYRSVRRGRHKLVLRSDQEGGELYDLASDPGEKTDLSAARPEILATLSAEMEARYRDFRLDGEDQNRVELDPEEAEKLRALGYIDP
jgi:arylsulfatase